jgi:copper chaperone
LSFRHGNQDTIGATAGQGKSGRGLKRAARAAHHSEYRRDVEQLKGREPMKSATLKVTGMTCNHCVMAVTNALEGVDGVSRADVSLDDGQAVVQYDDATATLEQMAAAVAEEGYTAELSA